MKGLRWRCAILLALTAIARGGNTGTDPAQKHAWGENVGWANAGPTNYEVTVHFNVDSGWLSGYAWGENVGWIVMGSAGGGPYANTTSNNWGVNLAANGDLSGYAWGENVGWVNFGHAQCDAAINPANPSKFKGAQNPVDQVSWEDCQRFLGKLNQRISGGGAKEKGRRGSDRA